MSKVFEEKSIKDFRDFISDELGKKLPSYDDIKLWLDSHPGVENLTNSLGQNLLHEACAQGGHSELVAYLCHEIKMDLNLRDKSDIQFSPLHHACASIDEDTLAVLLNHEKINPNQATGFRTHQVYSPLSYAAKIGNTAAFASLLEHDAIDLSDGGIDTLWCVLLMDEHIECLTMLFNHPNFNVFKTYYLQNDFSEMELLERLNCWRTEQMTSPECLELFIQFMEDKGIDTSQARDLNYRALLEELQSTLSREIDNVVIEEKTGQLIKALDNIESDDDGYYHTDILKKCLADILEIIPQKAELGFFESGDSSKIRVAQLIAETLLSNPNYASLLELIRVDVELTDAFLTSCPVSMPESYDNSYDQFELSLPK